MSNYLCDMNEGDEITFKAHSAHSSCVRLCGIPCLSRPDWDRSFRSMLHCCWPTRHAITDISWLLFGCGYEAGHLLSRRIRTAGCATFEL